MKTASQNCISTLPYRARKITLAPGVRVCRRSDGTTTYTARRGKCSINCKSYELADWLRQWMVRENTNSRQQAIDIRRHVAILESL